MSTQQPSEEELRAAYEEQIKQVRVEHVLLDNVVMLVNLGMRRTGLMPGTESERDVAQVRTAIESVRALMPTLEASAPEQAKQIREALSQLQMAYIQIGGSGSAEGSSGGGGEHPDPAAQPEPAGPPTEPTPEPAAGPAQGPDGPEPASPQPPASKPGEPGPAQRSGRLWVPGQ